MKPPTRFHRTVVNKPSLNLDGEDNDDGAVPAEDKEGTKELIDKI